MYHAHARCIFVSEAILGFDLGRILDHKGRRRVADVVTQWRASCLFDFVQLTATALNREYVKKSSKCNRIIKA